jgi:hypothetical protein
MGDVLEEKHIRKLWDRYPHAGARPILPMVGDSSTLNALNVELGERAGNGVEAGSEDDDVDIYMAKLGRDARRVYRFNWVLVDINYVDVVLADNFIEALL